MGEGKTEHAALLERKVRERLLPLFKMWMASGGITRVGTLIVQPRVTRFKIVSGAARFWMGAMRGQSSVDLTLKLVDGTAKKVIAEPNITQRSGAWAGAWSIGKSDKNIHEYMAGIIHQYMVSNY
jgi:hypothetical protein